MALNAVLLTVACFFVRANTVDNIYSYNGWRPMSIEKVLELQRNFIKTPNVHLQTLQNTPKRPLDKFETGNFVKIIHENELSKRPIEDHKVAEPPEDHTEDNMKYLELNKIIQPPYKEVMDKNINWETSIFSQTNQQMRKAKKIENSNIANLLKTNDKTVIKQPIDEKEDKNNEARLTVNNNYEVKEITEGDDQLASDQKLLYNKGFKYETAKNNFTANLLGILANYNIRTGDKLPNYAISLRPNSRKSHNHDFVLMHVPIKIPLTYNNANHLPVDPLLAVFLSNYGHYLPNLYGFHTGYKNLYGYLASNNIHNNKPFGSYKIFSDMD